MLTEKPYFTLQVNTADCVYELLVNGAYVHIDPEGSPLLTEFAVNPWISAGRNIITLNVYYGAADRPADGARAEIALCVRRAGSPWQTRACISRLHYSAARARAGLACAGSTLAGRYHSQHGFLPHAEGDVLIADVTQGGLQYADIHGISLSQELQFDCPLPPWQFLQGDDLPALESAAPAEVQRWHDELYRQYQQLHSDLDAGRLDRVLTRCELRCREMDAAFFLPPGSKRGELRAALAVGGGADQDALALSPEELGMEIMPNRKLVRMIRANGEPAIVFNHKTLDLSRAFDFIFMRRGAQWVIAR